MAGQSKSPRTRTVRIPMDDGAVEALEQAREDLADAKAVLDRDRSSRQAALRATRGMGFDEARLAVEQDDAQRLAPLLEQVAKAEDTVRDTLEPYRFDALGRKAYRALVADHATDEKPDPAGDGSEGFARALIQASCADPALSDTDMDEIFDGNGWNAGEISYLFAAAYDVNTKRRVVEL